jgi:hypothetical protein
MAAKLGAAVVQGEGTYVANPVITLGAGQGQRSSLTDPNKHYHRAVALGTGHKIYVGGGVVDHSFKKVLSVKDSSSVVNI